MMVPIHALQWYRFADTVTKTIILLDYTTNCDVDDPSKPLSHAFLIKTYVDGIYPYGEKTDTEAKLQIDKPQELDLF